MAKCGVKICGYDAMVDVFMGYCSIESVHPDCSGKITIPSEVIIDGKNTALLRSKRKLSLTVRN